MISDEEDTPIQNLADSLKALQATVEPEDK
jgi:hypothetical protein